MEDIESLLSRMTLEEKVGQMQQLSAGATPKEIFEAFKEKGEIGSFLHVLGVETGSFLEASSRSRMKIPPIFGIDAIHGHALLKGATVFPSQLAMACTWNEEMIEKVGEITAKEVAADGLNWVFSPVLCLGRDLRWGRIDETFGEDALLASRMGAAIIKGYQKDGLVAACAKHYLGYGEATGGRDAYDTEISERKAREVFLKPFKAAVDAGCMTFMTAYGSIDASPLTTNHRYLTEILKDEYGFDGFVVTDWENFRSLVTGQKVAKDMDEACVMGVKAGNDMSMNSDEFYDALLRAVKEGRIEEEVVNDCVRRILRVKQRLGLLDENKPSRPGREVIGCKEHQDFNYQVVKESAVLLKNNGVLPFKGAKRIAVIGPNADDVRAQYGDWTYFSHPMPKPWESGKEGVYTVLKGIQAVYTESEVTYAKGCSINDSDPDSMLLEAVEVAKDADAIIVVLGDNLSQNGEYRDRANLALSGKQNELLRALKTLQKPLICVLVNGKPLVIDEVTKDADAIIEVFNGGDQCGLALAHLLKGDENFSGKLPISFPYDSSATPCYYNQYDYWHGGRYIDVPSGSPYPFGFGLSYSQFAISNLRLSKPTVKLGESFKLSLRLENVSSREGNDVVQLYFKDKVCPILTPIRSLLDFQKVFVPANGSIEVKFALSTNQLGYYDPNCHYVVDPGEFEFFVSDDGTHFKTVCLTVE
ncbi:MAG: glycoside hydrolase family 3 N-terminal domain-containing protein [Erysipelotrichaceae bacterium]|nr:glycoside hydrolase family 3 N-terminal domain-containing protein [Erysipelotrichaceae bacterium]